MMRTLVSMLAGLVLGLAALPAAHAIPQETIEQLVTLSPDREPVEVRVARAEEALALWRAAENVQDRLRHATRAAAAAYEAGMYAEAESTAQFIVETPSSGIPEASANAALISQLIAYAADPAAEAALAEALDQNGAATPVLRARAARLLALAHMRRDEQPQAQARWLIAQDAGRRLGDRTYDFELAQLGLAASYGYSNEVQLGFTAIDQVFRRMNPSMVRFYPASEMTNAENIYAQAIAWRAALRTDHNSRSMERGQGYAPIGSEALDAQGRRFCRGTFRIRPLPRAPTGMWLHGWLGSSVLRLTTNAEGRVTHAEVVAAVPSAPLFTRVTLRAAPNWRFVSEEDPAQANCRLEGEGHLISFTFHNR